RVVADPAGEGGRDGDDHASGVEPMTVRVDDHERTSLDDPGDRRPQADHRPETRGDAERDRLRAADEAPLLRPAGSVEVPLEGPGVLLVARRRDVEERIEERELPGLAAEDRLGGRGRDRQELA